MATSMDDEWRLIRGLLPTGWEDAARTTGAFRRSRYMTEPATVLRMLLLHAVVDGGLRETVSLAKSGGIADISQVALLKRLRTSSDWLSWIARSLTPQRGREARPGMRLRAVDSTSISGPGCAGTDWRLHYAINLDTLDCDWHSLTDAHGGEALRHTPMSAGDVMLADRNYLSASALEAAQAAGATLVVRLRWRHLALSDGHGRPFSALDRCRAMRVGQVREWYVHAQDAHGQPVPGRVVAIRVSALVAAQAQRRIEHTARRKNRVTNPKTIEAAHFIMVFTTLPKDQASAIEVLQLYRCRWQIELAFKRMKQLLGIGRLPHRDARAARSWILAKLVVSLLIERLLAQSRDLSPWGHDITSTATTAA